MEISRRELCSLLPLALLSSAWGAEDEKLTSRVFKFEDLPVRKNNSGVESRPILKGKLPTGEQVEIHQTVLPPGGAPHPPHHHAHSEFWLIREGTVELTIQGTKYQLGPGSLGFAASNDEHGIKNIGSQPASYFVVAVGPMS